MTTNTPQELGRTENAHHHDDLDYFCLECITSNLFKPDFRADLALLTCMHLRHLAEHRAAAIGAKWDDLWGKVLDPDLLAADLESSDTLRRMLVRRAQATVQDFLIYRKATATPRRTHQVAHLLRAIEQRTRAQLDELGVEPREPQAPARPLN